MVQSSDTNRHTIRYLLKNDGIFTICNFGIDLHSTIDWTGMHDHLREPGREDEETIISGSHAAMAGGFTAVCCMPNTNPALHHRSQIEFVKKQSRELLVDVYPIGAVTKDRAGKELAEMGDMIDAGAVAFSDDGDTVPTAEMMRYALEYSKPR